MPKPPLTFPLTRLSGQGKRSHDPRRRIVWPRKKKKQGHPGLVFCSGRPGARPAPVWDCVGRKSTNRAKEADCPSLRWGRLYVPTHYSFPHPSDPDWAISRIKISGQYSPPRPGLILNGHEYVALQARKAVHHLPTKEETALRPTSDARRVGHKRSQTPCPEPRAYGRLIQVCERLDLPLLYARASTFDEQKRSRVPLPVLNYLSNTVETCLSSGR